MMRTARVPGSAELSMMAQYAMLHSDGENEWGADSGDNSAAAFFAERKWEGRDPCNSAKCSTSYTVVSAATPKYFLFCFRTAMICHPTIFTILQDF